MPNNSYIRGANFERSLIHKLEDNGFYAIRSAGSKKVFDVVGWSDKVIRFIQCKTTQKPPSIKTYLYDLRAIAQQKVPSNATKELHVRYGRDVTKILVL